MSFNIEVEGGTSVLLPTAGKYCDRDIVVKALGDGGGSGALKIAVGTITTTSSSATAPMITHNLGTQKIICLCWIPNDVVVTPTKGYQVFAVSFINAPAFFGESIQVDCTGYNSGKFSEVSTVLYKTLSLGAAMRSPWKTQNNFTAPNVSAGAISLSTITDNTITLKLGNANTFIAGCTYNYLVIAVP